MRWLSGSPIWSHCAHIIVFLQVELDHRTMQCDLWLIHEESPALFVLKVFLTPWVYVSVHILISILYIYLFINFIQFLGELHHMKFYWLNSHCLVIKTSNYVKYWEIIESETTHEDLRCTRNDISCFIYFTLHVGCTTWLRFGWTKLIYIYFLYICNDIFLLKCFVMF